MRLKSILSVGLFLLATMSVSAQYATLASYEVKVGETLYSVSKRYGLTVEELKGFNPELGDKLIAGQLIKVPDEKSKSNCRLIYEVKKKDTVYGLCKRFGVSVDDFFAANPNLEFKGEKLKRKQLVCIPHKREVVKVEPVVNEIVGEVEPLRVAVLLPFNLEQREYDATNLKMLDFYEGFLLAVDELRLDGLFADIHAYDETLYDSIGINRLTVSPELKKMDVIIGPYNNNNVARMVEFVSKNDISLVVPFASRENYTTLSDKVFQLNAPQTLFYGKVYDAFIRENADKNIIFMHTNERGDNEMYYAGFKKSLSDKGINYKVIDIHSMSEKLMPMLSSDSTNVIVSVAPSEGAFKRMVHVLDGVPGVGTKEISVFGLSNWLQFAEANKESFQKYKCKFFTKFLYDDSDALVQKFTRNFQKNFKRAQSKSYPMYGAMGFDLGMYFLTGFYRHGDNFFENINGLRVITLQNPLLFERNTRSQGYYNNRIMFVDFDANGKFRKKEY